MIEKGERYDACSRHSTSDVHWSASKASMFKGAGHNRIRHFGRRIGGYCHFGDNDIPPEASGTVERDRRRYQQFVRDRAGQSTVEFAVVMTVVVAILVGMGALWNLWSSGLVVQHALESAAHHVQAYGALADIFSV